MTHPNPTPTPHANPDPSPAPRSHRAWRVFAIPAIAALIGYVLLYQFDARLRVAKGPWEVTFLHAPPEPPSLVIRQPALGVDDVTIRILGETVTNDPTAPSLPATVRFDAPQLLIPFGRMAFDDLMYLPGTVVLHCFGHEIQMLPRGLFLNRREHPWASGSTFTLVPTNKLPSLDPPPKRRLFQRPRPSAETPAAPPAGGPGPVSSPGNPGTADTPPRPAPSATPGP